MSAKSRLPDILKNHHAAIVTDWLQQQREALGHRAGDQREERDSAERFLEALGEGALTGNVTDIDRPEWSAARDLLTELLTGPRPTGLQSVGDGDVRLLAQAAALRPAAPGGRQGRRGPGRRDLDGHAAPRPLWPLHDGDAPEERARRSSAGSSRRCWSCRRPSCSCGTASWPCRSSARSTARARRSSWRACSSGSSRPARRSRSSTSPGCPPSTRWSPSTS